MSDGTRKRESGLVLMTLPPGIEGGRSEEVIIWMSRPVAARLLKLGFEQPVELDSLPGRWWSILVDLYTLDEVSEPGCGFRRAVANTETVAAYFGMGWLRIDAGPFDSANEAEAVYLAAAGTDTAWLGPDAKVVRVAPWISRKLSERGFPDPVALNKLAGLYWVCGMSEGCYSTEQLEARIRGERAGVDISHGPFDRLDDAEYYFDWMWESPE